MHTRQQIYRRANELRPLHGIGLLRFHHIFREVFLDSRANAATHHE